MEYLLIHSIFTGAISFISFQTWNNVQILRNCKVARILPRIADTAKNDRSAILRARYHYLLVSLPVPLYVQCTQVYSHYSRCCDYALLVLEYWADAPEIQRSADLYEYMIKCCVADAMSEVGSVFWPLLHTMALPFFLH
jgi:hypothetical protein